MKLQESVNDRIDNTWDNFVAKIGKRYLFDHYLYWKKHDTAVKVTDNGSVYITRPNDMKRRAFSQAKTFDEIYNILKQHKLLPDNLNENSEKELLETIVAYHGSQNDNLTPDFSRGFYLTNNKEMAIDFAKGYLFNYELADNETPTLYTYEVSFANPYIVKSEEEYEAHFTDRDVSEIITPLKQAGYDGIIIPEFETGCKYYVAFDNTKNVKLINKESIPEEEWIYESVDEILKEDKSNLNDAFWSWFGNSKVVDNNGNPLIVYHGSKAKFDTFDKTFSQGGTWGVGIYFGTDAYKNFYNGGNMYKAYLSIQKPFVVNSQQEYRAITNDAWDLYNKQIEDGVIDPFDDCLLYDDYISNWYLEEIGYDGIIAGEGIDTEYVVFRANQIKSVDNAGTWNSETANIYENTISQPIIAYHGSQNDFDAFNNNEKGIYFAPSNRRNAVAGYYADDQGYIYTCELNIKNPYYCTPNTKPTVIDCKTEGYDSIISIADDNFEDRYYDYETNKIAIANINKGDIIEIIVFEPEQIKIIDKKTLKEANKKFQINEDTLDLDPEELSKSREEDRELEKLSFQRPNKPMSKELRELLYGKKSNTQKSTTQKTTQKVSSKNNEDDVFTDPVVRSYSSYYDDEYNKFQKQLADIKFDIAYAEEHGDNPQQSKAELRNLEQKIYNRARYNLLLLDLLENKVCNSSKLNEDFYRWFQDSKVITETYEPKMVSLSENPKKVYGKGIYFDKENDGSVKAYLQISNPFRLNEEYSISTFRPYIENIDILCNKQKISGKELFSLLIEAKYGIQLDKMIDTTTMLQNLGFDGIETKNKWIVFSKKQIQKI